MKRKIIIAVIVIIVVLAAIAIVSILAQTHGADLRKERTEHAFTDRQK